MTAVEVRPEVEAEIRFLLSSLPQLDDSGIGATNMAIEGTFALLRGPSRRSGALRAARRGRLGRPRDLLSERH